VTVAAGAALDDEGAVELHGQTDVAGRYTVNGTYDQFAGATTLDGGTVQDDAGPVAVHADGIVQGQGTIDATVDQRGFFLVHGSIDVTGDFNQAVDSSTADAGSATFLNGGTLTVGGSFTESGDSMEQLLADTFLGGICLARPAQAGLCSTTGVSAAAACTAPIMRYATRLVCWLPSPSATPPRPAS
jgi:hypothetical protein